MLSNCLESTAMSEKGLRSSYILRAGVIFGMGITVAHFQSAGIYPSLGESLNMAHMGGAKLMATGYQDALCAARELADTLEVDPIFKEIRPRRRKKAFDYESNDNVSETSEEKYKREFFDSLVNTAQISLEERFVQLQNHKHTWRLLYVELENIRHILPSEKHATQQVLQFILETKLNNIFPNLWVALRILLTLPVTVASGERSFSKLKIIKLISVQQCNMIDYHHWRFYQLKILLVNRFISQHNNRILQDQSKERIILVIYVLDKHTLRCLKAIICIEFTSFQIIFLIDDGN